MNMFFQYRPLVAVVLAGLIGLFPPQLSASTAAPEQALGGDLEGPDYLLPPKHFRTLKAMLHDVNVPLIGEYELPPYQIQSFPPSPGPLTGTREILVILVELSDVSPDPAHDAAYFDGRFFDTTAPSVRHYYSEVSYNNFTFVPGDVLGWYASSYSQTDWTTDKRQVVEEAITLVDPDFDFSPYDADSDGYVTNEELTIFVIVSGDQGGASHWWTTNVVSADGKTIGDSSLGGRLEFCNTHEERHIGSYVHELGHSLGLPDLYDTDDTITGDSEGIGQYGLMGGGSWTFSHLTAWSKIQLGWITPTIVTAPGWYTVQDSETHAQAYILIDSTHSADEYFLVENKHPANSYYESVGAPVAPDGTYPDDGIMIYHVDETKIQDWLSSGTNNVNADETHKAVDVETAEHATSDVQDADDLDAERNRGDADDLWDEFEYDFFDGSAPCHANWYSTASGMAVAAFPAVSDSMTVYFLGVPPIADAGGPYNGSEGTAITLSASGSGDPDGIIVLYEWDIDDDGSFDATGETVTWTWPDDYSGTISLRVTDDDGITMEDSTTIVIANVAPTVDAGTDQSANEGDSVAFSGSFSDPGSDIHSIVWDFGDATTASGTLTPSHAYGDNGAYTVTLTVTDDDGGVGSDTLTVTVNNVAPTVEAGPDQTVNEGDIATFGGSFTDPGWLDTHTIVWDFGDGTTESGTRTPSHAYGDNGAYTVTLTVTDDDGGVGSDTLTVTVNNVAPTASYDSLDQPNPFFILPGVHTLTFHGSFTDPGWLDTHVSTWDFGDGTSASGALSEENVPPDATGTTSADHIYDLTGDYTITLTVTDDDGDSGSDNGSVHVATADEALSILDDHIQASPGSGFKKPADNRKNALSNKLSAISKMVEVGAYRGAIKSLQNDVRAKADGHFGGKPNDDWITDKTLQQEVLQMIDDIVAYLETLM